MKLRLNCIGRMSERYLREGVEDFSGRIGRYLPFSTVELKEEKHGDPRQIREREGERLRARIPAQAFTIVLDEKGKGLTSEGLAALIDRHMVEGTGEIALVIGGPYGLDSALKERADQLLSLSPMTLTHQMARLLLLEQIYRALTIIRNEPYHNR